MLSGGGGDADLANAARRAKEAVRQLLEAGVDPNRLNRFGRRPIQVAGGPGLAGRGAHKHPGPPPPWTRLELRSPRTDLCLFAGVWSSRFSLIKI